MLSLAILLSLIILSLLITAWTIDRCARAVGSPRSRFRVALVAALILFAINLLFSAAMFAAASNLPQLPKPPLQIAFVLAQWIAFFFILKRAFRLSIARTFAPLGALVAIFIAEGASTILLIRPHIAEAFVMSGISMSPTLTPGDRILVEKLEHPRRLDLVAQWTQSRHPIVVVHRLIALPGERLRFHAGNVYVNDKFLHLPSPLAGHCHAYIGPLWSRYQDDQTITLGPDEFFFLGDNLDRALDSRSTGPIPATSIIGVADLVYWPPTHVRILRSRQ